MNSPDPLIGQLLADRYRILSTLGEGGMGRVYLAQHERMGRMSAVKVMSPALVPTPDAISRFNREAANASRINHPNVAAIYDFGETADGTLYLAMEYVEGETLSALLTRSGALSLTDVADITNQVAAALHAAHHLGIVHRDLKPDNILITRDVEGRRLVKVVDFGIAKTMQGGGQTVTTAGMSIGTPQFMSPEQLAGDTLDARTDIYSLGLVTFTMLTGETPFTDLTSKQSLVQRLTTRPRALSEVRPAVTWPAKLQAALDGALSPEPSDRYAKVADFARDVVAASAIAPDLDAGRTRAMTPLATPVVKTVPTPEIAPKPAARRNLVPLIAGMVVAASAAGFVVWRASGTRDVPPPDTLAAASADTLAPVSDTPSTPVASQVAVQSTPVVAPPPMTIARRDSTPRTAPSTSVAPPPETTGASEVSPPAPASSTRAAHPWLAGSGDSVTGPLPVVSPYAAQAREVLGHTNRARRYFVGQQPGKALPELRTALDEYFTFAAAHPATRETQMLRAQLTTMAQTAMSDCPATVDTLSPRERRAVVCANLAKALARLGQTGGSNAGPFPGRRPQRRMGPPRP